MPGTHLARWPTVSIRIAFGEGSRRVIVLRWPGENPAARGRQVKHPAGAGWYAARNGSDKKESDNVLERTQY